MNGTSIAKFLMKLAETHPISPDTKIGELQEVFRHNVFLYASETRQKQLMLASSMAKYRSELDYPWDTYFGLQLSPFLEDKVVLDLGCFNGGRSVAWFERYKMDMLFGVDVDQVFIHSATQFATFKNVKATFTVSKGEELPFEETTFDAVLSFDVFEHVQNLEKTLDECWRVLKPGGRLFVVFPGYFHPIEHHLGLATQMPFIHYFFNSKTLINAYCQILDERGNEAYWYRRHSSEPEKWERCNTINGTTLSRFKRLLRNRHWTVVLHSRRPIGSIGRNITKQKFSLMLSRLCYPLACLPGIQEICLHRITYILQKNGQ